MPGSYILSVPPCFVTFSLLAQNALHILSERRLTPLQALLIESHDALSLRAFRLVLALLRQRGDAVADGRYAQEQWPTVQFR